MKNTFVVDILCRQPDLELADYSHIEIHGHDDRRIKVELRDGHLIIRQIGGKAFGCLTIRPVASNTIEIDLGELP